jgi:hypothetical protein
MQIIGYLYNAMIATKLPTNNYTQPRRHIVNLISDCISNRKIKSKSKAEKKSRKDFRLRQFFK